MSETATFSIKLSSIWWQLPPMVNIYLNDELIESNVAITEKEENGQVKVVSFSRELEEGEHTLSIEYFNKLDSDTKVDENGKITKDQVLLVKDISIDDIDLGNVIAKTSVYFPRSDRVEALDWLEAEIPGMCSTGHNGFWKMKFSIPTYLWLLENL